MNIKRILITKFTIWRFIFTAVLILAIVPIFLSPMSSGSKDAVEEIKGHIITLKANELSEKYGNDYYEIQLGEEVIKFVCQDSHSRFFGGNMVVECSGIFYLYNGHVCGASYGSMQYELYCSEMKQKNLQVSGIGFMAWLKDALQSKNGLTSL